MIYDCVIIGGGPAGLNAALVLGRARRNVVLIDNNKARNAVTHASHGFITRDGVTPSEFRNIASEELQKYPSIDQIQSEVKTISQTDFGFEMFDMQGVRIQAKKLILSTGVKEVFPAIEGLHSFYGKSLFNCPYCDGWELRDQPLVIVSEYPSIYHIAKLVYNWSKDLVVCTNGQPNLSDEQKQKLQSKGIIVIEQPVTSFIGQNGQLQYIRFADGTQIARAGGFVSPKLVESTTFADQLGYERTELGGIKTDDLGRTSIRGLYTAGDSSYVMPSQLIFAAADGSRTAIVVNTDLTEEDFE